MWDKLLLDLVVVLQVKNLDEWLRFSFAKTIERFLYVASGVHIVCEQMGLLCPVPQNRVSSYLQ